MVERGDGARLLLEAAHAIGIVGNGLGKDLDGDRAIQAGIASAIHLAHSALADMALNFIRTEFFACRNWHSNLAAL